MHKSESIQENVTHKIPWEFEIQTNHLIPAKKLDFILINKKKNVISYILPFWLSTVKIK